MKKQNAQWEKIDETLTDMIGRPMLIVWDIMWACMMLSFELAFGVGTGHYGAAAPTVIGMGGMLMAGHITFTMYYNHRSYCKKMLSETKKYLNIANEEAFCEALEQNLRNKMNYRFKKFVISQDYMMGYTERDTFFDPVAIPICTIASAEWYEVRVTGRAARTLGMLACKLNNGKTVVFCTSQGKDRMKVRTALEQCQIAYTCR